VPRDRAGARRRGESGLDTSELEVRRASANDLRLGIDDATLELLPVAVCVCDRDGAILRYNRRAAELWGRSPARGERFYGGESPMPALLRSGRTASTVEMTIAQPGGERLSVLVTTRAIIDPDGEIAGGISCFQDITERNIAQEALVESAELARGIIATALDGFVQIDETATILEWNPQMEAIFGWSRDQAVGQSLISLCVPPEQQAEHKSGLDRYLHSGQTRLLNRRVQLQGLRRDGTEIIVEAAFTALRRRPGCLFNGFIRDVTERLAADAQLRQAQKMEAIGQLTGGIAHDFNNLLAAIIPNLELAQGRIADERTLHYLSSAVRAAGRGARLTDQLLAFARKQELVTGPVEINQLIRDMGEMLLRTIGPTVTIKTSLDEFLWLAETDASQLELAILNLALNARDAMPTGGNLAIATANLAETARPVPDLDPGAYVAITVSDTGTGMSDAVIARVFEPFFTTKPAGRGSGLGLSMVYGFARQSGGTVAIDSELGRGTSVRLYLPRSAAASAVVESAGEEGRLDAGRPGRLLVVDDDAGVREITAMLARDLGHEAEEADSGDSALELLQRDRRFDLLVVDLAMPNMHGSVFAEQARVLLPLVPILFVTGYPEPARTELARSHMLKKPYRRADLAAKLRALLGTGPGGTDRRRAAGPAKR
jgi:PAS domain S-box-containing protein